LLNLVWMFVVVNRLKTAYVRMGEAGRLTARSDAGHNVGRGMALCMVLSIILLIGGLFALIGFVLWISHWVQVSHARRLVRAPTLVDVAAVHALGT